MTNYFWTDYNLLPGQTFYRLTIVESNRVSYSRALSIYNKKPFSIDKIYASSSAIHVSLVSDRTRVATVRIINLLGEVVDKLSYTISSPSVSLTIPVSKLPVGQYFLGIESLDTIDAKAFHKLQ